MAGPPIAVFILTGFLGSGKTTLLNRAVREPEFSDSAIIVNEFGQIGLDHRLIATARDNIVLLESGCLCCVLVDSFRETLADLYHRRAIGKLPAFSRVLVETSGLADPAPLLQTLMKDAVVAPLFAVGGVIAVVDAVHGLTQLAEHHEAIAQIAVADRVVVSKTDLTSKTMVAELATQLLAINPSVSLKPVPSPPERVGTLFQLDRVGEVQRATPAHRHASNISGECFVVSAPVSWAGIAAWTAHLRERWGDDLLRCKALLRLQNGGVALVQGVRRTFDTARAKDLTAGAGCAVCIGRGLDRSELAEGLAWLVAPEGVAVVATSQPPPWPSPWEGT